MKIPIASIMRMASDLRRVAKRYERIVLLLALAVFCGGSVVSAIRLDLGLADIGWGNLTLLILVMVPLGIFYGSISMMVMVGGAGLRLSWGDALRVSSLSTAAELLPLPGGAIVRGGAMIRRGIAAGTAASHVLVNAVLWLGCASCAAGATFGLSTLPGTLLGVGGLAGVMASVWWLGRHAGIRWTMAALSLRMIGLGLTGVRIAIAFAAVGCPIAVTDAFPFAFATILGSASSLTPGGLGIAEALAAGMATIADQPPGAAFLAVGIDRLASIGISAALAGALYLIDRDRVTASA